MAVQKISIKTTCKKMLADVFTPVGIYLRLRDRYRDTILLESADFHSAENSWSFIAVQAIAGFECKDLHHAEYKLPGMPPVKQEIKKPEDLAGYLDKFLNRFELADDCAIPAARHLFGYSSYDAVQFYEQISLAKKPFSQKAANMPAPPLLRYRLHQYVIAINHFKDELYLCENLLPGVESDVETLESYLYSKNIPTYPFAPAGSEESNLTNDQYLQMVKTGIDHCYRGNVFQIVLSRRFEQGFTGDEFNVYRALRSINPSPYLFYFDYGDYRIFGSSPESQIVIEKGEAKLHPIAGTFSRTGSLQQDQLKAEELLKDPKENAEHVMLVDLARNDLSRHSTQVQVSSYRQVHYYSHVIHLVSEVIGSVKPGAKAFDVMADTFPAGTLSGAPKYKAMQIIDELEPTRRGIYGGAIGMLGLDGSLNHAIMIRTFFSRSNTLFYQAGAGVVARSVPQSELQEVNNKLGALKQAITLAATLKSNM